MSNIDNDLQDLRNAIITTNFSDKEYHRNVDKLFQSIESELNLLSGEKIMQEEKIRSLEASNVHLQIAVKNLEYFFGAEDRRIKPEKMKNFLIEQFKIEHPEDFI